MRAHHARRSALDRSPHRIGSPFVPRASFSRDPRRRRFSVLRRDFAADGPLQRPVGPAVSHVLECSASTGWVRSVRGGLIGSSLLVAVSLLSFAARPATGSASTTPVKPLGGAPALLAASRGIALLAADQTSVHLLDVKANRRFSVPVPSGQKRCDAYSISWGRVALECIAADGPSYAYYVLDISTGAWQGIGPPGSSLHFGGLGRYYAGTTDCSPPGRCRAGPLYDPRTGTPEPFIDVRPGDLDLDRPDGLASWCGDRRSRDLAAGRTVLRHTGSRLTFFPCGRKRRTAVCKDCRLAGFDGTRLLAVSHARLWEFRLLKHRVVRRSWRIAWLDPSTFSEVVLAGRTALLGRPKADASSVSLYSVALV